MEPTEVERRVDAATAVVSGLGLDVSAVVEFQQANRLTLRLLPCDVFARVAPTIRSNIEIAAFEVDVALQLEEAGGPIGVLDPRVQSHLHVDHGYVTTLWKYYEPAPSAALSPAAYASVLQDLHAAMRSVDVPAPHFTDRVDEAVVIVEDRSKSPGLVEADRDLLAQALTSLRRVVVNRAGNEQLLHGEPHEGNLLATTEGLRFIDFETCCYGPIEFDIAHAPDDVADHYALADRTLIRDCRLLKHAMVATWRSDRDDVFPNGTQMRDELLTELRASLDGGAFDRNR